MLLINSAMFISTVIKLTKLDREKRRLNLRSAKDRNETMEKYVKYLDWYWELSPWIYRPLAENAPGRVK